MASTARSARDKAVKATLGHRGEQEDHRHEQLAGQHGGDSAQVGKRLRKLLLFAEDVVGSLGLLVSRTHAT